MTAGFFLAPAPSIVRSFLAWKGLQARNGRSQSEGTAKAEWRKLWVCIRIRHSGKRGDYLSIGSDCLSVSMFAQV